MVTMVNVIHLIDTVLVCRRWSGGGPEGERKGGMGWGGEEGWVGEEGWGWDGWGGEEEGGGFIASAEGGDVFETLLHKLLCVMGV